MSKQSILTSGAIALALLGGPAAAQQVWIGTPSGVLLKGDAHAGGFQWIGGGCGGCAGPVNSMVASGDTVFVGDTTGNIYRLDADDNAIGYAYTVQSDATSLAVDGSHLLVGGTNALIRRVVAATGVLQTTLQSPFGSTVDAMAITGSSLTDGSDSTIFAEGNAATGNFQVLGACGGSIQSMARRGDDLFLGDVNGNVYRFDFATHQLGYAFTLQSDNQAMVVDGSHLLVGGTNGIVQRVNSVGGAVVASWNVGLPISALAIGAAPSDPGTMYCLGLACPCGNDDAEGGCANTTGHGAVVRGEGSASVAADDLELRVEFLPANVLSRMYMSQTQGSVPFGDGLNCAGGGGYPAFRFGARSAGVGGVLVEGPGIAAYSALHFGAGGAITPGSTWNFQAWYRNPGGPCGSNFNTSSALSVVFTN